MDQLTVPGVGELARIEDVEGCCWVLEGPVVLNVTVPEETDLAAVDLGLIAAVWGDLDEVLAQARAAVLGGVAEGGDWGPGALREPELTFWPEATWAVRFADSDLPGTEELGVLVEFAGREVVGVDDLSGAEAR